ncbi:hypothetical protein ACFWIQ_10020 [Kitasatospora sp. NPDC127059]
MSKAVRLITVAFTAVTLSGTGAFLLSVAVGPQTPYGIGWD